MREKPCGVAVSERPLFPRSLCMAAEGLLARDAFRDLAAWPPEALPNETWPSLIDYFSERPQRHDVH